MMISYLLALNPLWVKNFENPNLNLGAFSLHFLEPKICSGKIFFPTPEGKLYQWTLHGQFEKSFFNSSSSLEHSTSCHEPLAVSQLGEVFFKDQSLNMGLPLASTPFKIGSLWVLHLKNESVVVLNEKKELVWQHERTFFKDFMTQRIAPIVHHEGFLYVGYSDGVLRKLNLKTGKMEWQIVLAVKSKFKDIDLYPQILNNYLVVSSVGFLTAFVDIQKGTIEKIFPYTLISPMIKEKEGYIFPTAQSLIFLNDNFEITHEKSFKPSLTHVKKMNSQYLLANKEGVLSLYSKDFKLESSFSFGGKDSSIISDLILSDNYITFYTSRNRLYLFHLK